MQIPEEWVEPKAWWASTWTGLTSLLRFFHPKGSHVPGEQSPERSRDLQAEPADLGSNPSPNSHCPSHPGQVPSSQRAASSLCCVVTQGSRHCVVTQGSRRTGAHGVAAAAAQLGAGELGISAHHVFLRLPEKTAFSLGLQPGRARAPWESCDFLNEWHPLPNRVLAPLFRPCENESRSVVSDSSRLLYPVFYV